jgi:uncharacterized protein YndB with AHSA1/START domain
MSLRALRIVLLSAAAFGVNCHSFAEAPAAPAKVTEPLVVQGVVNAPLPEVWKVFSTAEGFKKLGVAHCEMDFRVGGSIRSHYDPEGQLGDEGTIYNDILSFEPERMLSIRIQKSPVRFPFSEATWKKAWTVITLSQLRDRQTHVRMTGLGYPDTDEGRAMRRFFENGNAWVIEKLRNEFDPSSTPPTSPAHAPRPLAPVSHERVVERPRAEIWRLLTTGAGWEGFMNARATIELRPEGKFEILLDSKAPKGQQGSEECKVLSLIPERMLSFSWNAPPRFGAIREKRTWVVVSLDELEPEHTRVRIEHLGFAEQAADNKEHSAEWEQVRAYFQQAWGKVLDALEKPAP